MQKKLSVRLAAPLLVALLTVLAAAPATAQSMQSENSTSMPKVGQMAPDFTLNYFDGNDLKPISLSQYRGKKNVVVAFYIFAFTGG
jgi:cytochrome oxidase Cu insertion factor (SCO1/SenC/PrrC family)